MRSNQLNYVPGGIGSLTHLIIAQLSRARLRGNGGERRNLQMCQFHWWAVSGSNG
jgi:hypothetical protein